ncbi:MAG: MFS transporter [Chloroflexi bacterium]|nr:MFS transporter [Chloroflexota bacterium]
MTDTLQREPDAPTLSPTRPAPWWRHLFSSLRHRDFRLLWVGQTLQSEGQWMEQVARGWLLWELSHDPFMLGLYGTLRTVPALALAVPAGILTDRLSRVALIQFSQISACLLAFIFAALVQTHVVAVWMVLAFALLNGTSEVLRMPARQSMVATLVPGRDLLNAVAVNEVAQYTMRIAGPLLAGGIMSAFVDDAFLGVAAVFYVRGLLYLIAVVTTAYIQAPPMPTQARGRTVAQNLGDTFRYLASNRVLLALAVLGAVPAAFGQPYQHLMPVFALDIFDVGAFGLGVMSAAVGVGALLGSLVLAGMGNIRPMGLVLFFSLAGYGASMILFGLNPWFLASLLLLLLLGASQAGFFAMRQTLTQLIVRDEQRGRVVGVTQLTRGGLSPLGSLQAGALAGILGAPVAVMIMGATLGSIALLSGFLLTAVRRLEYSEELQWRTESRDLG